MEVWDRFEISHSLEDIIFFIIFINFKKKGTSIWIEVVMTNFMSYVIYTYIQLIFLSFDASSYILFYQDSKKKVLKFNSTILLS